MSGCPDPCRGSGGPRPARLLASIAGTDRMFDAVVIGEPQRAFYGNQFGLTFPVLTHFGVQLWVPEVGGVVDPGSEAHDMVMMLFGGMSKAERTRVQLRVKVAMADMADRTDRFLGGRPPYGYSLVDDGPHPNPAKAAAGQVAHRLEMDPLAAPVVQRIFRMYVEEGYSVRAIAQLLTDEGIPSPSAHDPARNRHRDGRGWAFSAVRAILGNPTYAGRRVWGRQEKFESLLDPSDVAAGSQTRMRWREKETWIRPGQVTHPAIVDEHLVAAAEQLLSARVRPERTRQRPTEHPYALRGLLKCGICGSTMQGSFRKSRADGPGRVLYRCEIRRSRALPPELVDTSRHRLRPAGCDRRKVDEWISSLASAEVLAAGQLPDPVDRTNNGPPLVAG